MRVLALLLIPLAMVTCRRPLPLPQPKARLLVRFLDRDADLVLSSVPGQGPWRIMNAGIWEPLEVRWDTGALPLGAAVVGRTAPDWVLVADPAGEIHRVVMRGPGPEELAERNRRMTDQDREALSLLGVLWVLGWVRH